jgi:hypothetical protein
VVKLLRDERADPQERPDYWKTDVHRFGRSTASRATKTSRAQFPPCFASASDAPRSEAMIREKRAHERLGFRETAG